MEGALLEAWSRGDTEAGRRLYATHFDAVYRFFRTKVDGDVSDLVQETFVAALQAAARFEGRSSVKTFLLGVARHHLFDHYRSKQRALTHDMSISAVNDTAPRASELVLRKSEQRLVLEALRRLSVDDQTLLELFYWEELSGSELAQIFEVPEGTIRSRLRRAHERLRSAVESLATSSEQLSSTMSNLEGWAASLRNELLSASST
ncbi:MAG: sigma-70 family RNA polymerase sigma factor [Polyangiaceae bacterium]